MTGGASLLVIGGTGFFGKSILDAFRRGLLEPWNVTRVIAAARNPAALRSEYPDLIAEGVELATLDIATATHLPEADFIIHAANTSDARRYAADPQAERAAILAAADNFVRLAATSNREARIVYTSSGAVYGAQPATIDRIDEDRRPTDAGELIAYKRDYAEAKLLAERAIANLGRDVGIRVAVARCFAFIGPYLPQDRHFAAGNFLADGLGGRPVTVTAGHPVIRSYLHADDLVEWLMTIAAHAAPDCPVYNVGSDEAVEVGDLARRIAALCGVPVVRAHVSAGPVDRYVPSIARAGERLGLAVRRDLDVALAVTMRRLTAERRAPRRSQQQRMSVEGAVH